MHKLIITVIDFFHVHSTLKYDVRYISVMYITYVFKIEKPYNCWM